MSGVAVSPEASDAFIMNTLVSDIQSDVTVDGTAIAGTLKWLAAGDIVEQGGAGNYLALKFAPARPDYVVAVGVGDAEPVVLDDDLNGVFKVADGDTTFTVAWTVDGETTTDVYDLTGLVLEPEPAKALDLAPSDVAIVPTASAGEWWVTFTASLDGEPVPLDPANVTVESDAETPPTVAAAPGGGVTVHGLMSAGTFPGALTVTATATVDGETATGTATLDGWDGDPVPFEPSATVLELEPGGEEAIVGFMLGDGYAAAPQVAAVFDESSAAFAAGISWRPDKVNGFDVLKFSAAAGTPPGLLKVRVVTVDEIPGGDGARGVITGPVLTVTIPPSDFQLEGD